MILAVAQQIVQLRQGPNPVGLIIFSQYGKRQDALTATSWVLAPITSQDHSRRINVYMVTAVSSLFRVKFNSENEDLTMENKLHV